LLVKAAIRFTAEARRAQRTRSKSVTSDIENNSLYAILEKCAVEIDQQTQLEVSGFEVGKHLCLMRVG